LSGPVKGTKGWTGGNLVGRIKGKKAGREAKRNSLNQSF